MKNIFKKVFKFFAGLLLVLIVLVTMQPKESAAATIVDHGIEYGLEAVSTLNATSTNLEVELKIKNTTSHNIDKATILVFFDSSALSAPTWTRSDLYRDSPIYSYLPVAIEDMIKYHSNPGTSLLTTNYANWTAPHASSAPLASWNDAVGYQGVMVVYDSSGYNTIHFVAPGETILLGTFNFPIQGTVDPVNDEIMVLAGGVYNTPTTPLCTYAWVGQPGGDSYYSNHINIVDFGGGGGGGPTGNDPTINSITFNSPFSPTATIAPGALTSNTNGNVSPGYTFATKQVGEAVTMTVANDANTTINAVTVDGSTVTGSGGIYTFNLPSSAATAAVPVVITVNASNGTFTYTFGIKAAAAAAETYVVDRVEHGGSNYYTTTSIPTGAAAPLGTYIQSTQASTDTFTVYAASGNTIKLVSYTSASTSVTATPTTGTFGTSVQVNFNYLNGDSITEFTFEIKATSAATRQFKVSVAALYYSTAILDNFIFNGTNQDTVINSAAVSAISFNPAVGSPYQMIMHTSATAINFEATLPSNLGSTTIQYKFDSGSYATLPAGHLTSGGASLPLTPAAATQLKLLVTAPSGATKEYTFNITKIDPNNLVDDIHILSNTLGYLEDINNLSTPLLARNNNPIPYTNNQVTIRVNSTENIIIKNITYEGISYPGTKNPGIALPFAYYANAAATEVEFTFTVVHIPTGVEVNYMVKVERDPAESNFQITSLQLHEVGGTSYNMGGETTSWLITPSPSGSNPTFTINNIPFGTTNFTLDIETFRNTVTKSALTGGSVFILNSGNPSNGNAFSVPVGANTWSVVITLTAQNGSSRQVTIVLNFDAPNGDSSVTNIFFDSASGITSDTTPGDLDGDFGLPVVSSPYAGVYTYNPAPYSLNDFYIRIVTTSANATFVIKNSLGVQIGAVYTATDYTSKQISLSLTNADEYFVVEVKAQDNTYSRYKIVVHRVADDDPSFDIDFYADSVYSDQTGISVTVINSVPKKYYVTLDPSTSTTDVYFKLSNYATSVDFTVQHTGLPVAYANIARNAHATPYVVVGTAESGRTEEVWVYISDGIKPEITNITGLVSGSPAFSFAPAPSGTTGIHQFASINITNTDAINFSVDYTGSGVKTSSLGTQITKPALFTFGPASNNTYTVTFTAFSSLGDEPVVYEIEITVTSGDTNKNLREIQVNGTAVTSTLINYSDQYYYRLDKGTSAVQIDVFASSTVATAEIKKDGAGAYNLDQYVGTLTDGYHKFLIKVTPQSGAAKDYELHLFIASNDYSVSNFQILDGSAADVLDVDSAIFPFNIGTFNYTNAFKVERATYPNIKFLVTMHPDAAVTFSPGNHNSLDPLVSSPTSYQFIVESEYYQLLFAQGLLTEVSDTCSSNPYTFIIEPVNPSDDSKLLNLYVEDVTAIGTDLIAYNSSINTYNINNLTNGTTYNFNIKVYLKPNQTIQGVTLNNSAGPDTHVYANVTIVAGTNLSMSFRVIPESGNVVNSTNYIINFNVSGGAPLGTDGTLNSVEIQYYDKAADAFLIVSAPETAPGSGIYKPAAKLPATADVAYIIVNPTDPKATVSGDGLKSLNFGVNPFTPITITAEDGTPGDTFTVHIDRDTYNTDDSIQTNGFTYKLDSSMGSYAVVPGFPNSDKKYVIYADQADTDIHLLINPTSSKATVNANAHYGLVPGLNTFVLTVQAEDPNKAPVKHTVLVYVPEDADLTNLEVEGKDGMTYPFVPNLPFTTTVTTYRVEVPYSYLSGSTYLPLDLATIIATPNDPSFQVFGDGAHALLVGDNIFTINVLDSNGIVAKTYTLNIHREAPDDDNLLADLHYVTDTISATQVVTPGLIFDPLVNNYTVIIPRSSLSTQIEFLPTLPAGSKASVSQSNPFYLISGGNEYYITITVISESNKPNPYIVRVIYAEVLFDIIDIRVTDTAGFDIEDEYGSPYVVFVNTTNGYYAEIGPAVADFIIEVTVQGNYSKVYFNGMLGVPTLSGSNTIFRFTHTGLAQGSTVSYQVTSKSEAEVMENKVVTRTPYTINVKREESNPDLWLTDLEVYFDFDSYANAQPYDNSVVFDKDLQYYVISNIGSDVDYFKIKATANDPAHIITNATSPFATALPFALNFGATGGGAQYLSHKVTVSDAVDPTIFKDYVILLIAEANNLSADADVIDIKVIGSDGNEYLVGYSQSNHGVYDILLPANVQGYTILATASTGAQFNGDANKAFTIAQGTNRTHTLSCTSENGAVTSPDYTIKVTRETASDDNKLTSLFIDGVQPLSFDPTNAGPYIVKRPYGTANVALSVVLSDPATATVNSADIGTKPLNVGPSSNLFNITVIAENGDIMIYTVIVEVEDQLPYLIGLTTSEYADLLENDLETILPFDKFLNQYYLVVPYSITSIDPIGTPENPAYTVDPSGHTYLSVGPNNVVVTVRNSNNDRNRYYITVVRLPEASANTDAGITIAEVNEFNLAYNNNQDIYFKDSVTEEYYVVKNEIKDLTVTVVLANPAGKYQIINDKNLRIGDNTVYIIIEAEDGQTVRTVKVHVHRSAMEVSVDKAADSSITITDIDVANLHYELDAQGKSLNDIDFLALVQTNTTISTKAVLTDLNENENEVIISVTDGEDTITVKFTVKNTKEQNDKKGLSSGLPAFLDDESSPYLIGLLACLLMLMIIAGIANKDKFGKVVKKRQKDLNKRERAEAK